MNLEMIIVFGILTMTVILFASDRLRLDVVALMVVLLLLLTGILTPEIGRASCRERVSSTV